MFLFVWVIMPIVSPKLIELKIKTEFLSQMFWVKYNWGKYCMCSENHTKSLIEAYLLAMYHHFILFEPPWLSRTSSTLTIIMVYIWIINLL